jgi:hypothetical protein
MGEKENYGLKSMFSLKIWTMFHNIYCFSSTYYFALPSRGTYIRVFEAGSFVKRECTAVVGK